MLYFIMEKESGTRFNSIRYIITTAVIKLLFDIMYLQIIYPVYHYTGFVSNFTWKSYAISWLILMAYSYFGFKMYCNRNQKLSYEVFYIIFLISFLPFVSMVGCGAFESDFIIWNCIYYFVLFSALILSNYIQFKVNRKRIQRKYASNQQITILTLFFFLIVLYISGKYTGFRFNFSFSNVYDLRLEAREYSMPVILSYLYSWARAIMPILLIIFLRQKKYAISAICIITQLLSFGIEGSKSTILMMFIAIGIQFIPLFSVSKFNKWINYGLILFLILSMFEYYAYSSTTLSSTIFRRMSYLPNWISSKYFDFFSNHVPDYFRKSFLRHLGLASPYSEEIPRMIGRLYMGNEQTNANNGLIADAIANMGYLGVVIMPILVVYVMRILDRSASGLDIKVYITIAIGQATLLMNSFLASAFLTSGVLITIVVLRIIDRDRANSFSLFVFTKKREGDYI